MKKAFLSLLTIAALVMSGCGKDDVKVNPDNPNNPDKPDVPVTGEYQSLKGSNYFPMILDETAAAMIKNKTVTDLFVNDFTDDAHYNGWINLWFWNGLDAAEAMGPNFYGNLGYLALTVNSSEWFGFAPALSYDTTIVGVERGGTKIHASQSELTTAAKNALAKMAVIDATYNFHIAFKSQRNGVYKISLSDGVKEAGVTIGTTANDGTDFYFTRNGEWVEFDIPMARFIAQGLNYANIVANAAAGQGLNLWAITQADGFVMPSDVNIDAVFFYQPAK